MAQDIVGVNPVVGVASGNQVVAGIGLCQGSADMIISSLGLGFKLSMRSGGNAKSLRLVLSIAGVCNEGDTTRRP
jgi:hypothetical protein